MDSKWKYDVFLSFRGADTRKGFTGHLYHALKQAGIHTYKDDKEMENGQEISEACLNAIEESRFSLVVLSKGYASSSWCLDELVHMLYCRKVKGHNVWPLFYDVDDPSDIEEIKGSFGKAFKDMIQKNSEVDMRRVAVWKNALIEVCCLKGLDLPRLNDGHEARNIDNIVKQILTKLDQVKLYVPSNAIGLDTRAKKVTALITNKPGEVCIIGICGMAGIGKTTIANKVYNLVSDGFDGRCFLESVREKSHTVGFTQLQKELLSQTLRREYRKIYNVDQGLTHIRDRLCWMRVLIVLDDVNEVEQVDKLLGNVDWLYPGSTVIITTREMDLLPFAFYQQYKVDKLNKQEAMQLFSFHAFDKSYPLKDYEDCALSAVEYAGGIPLALKLLGSYLHGQSIDVWKSKLQKLRVYGDPKVHKIIQISYDSLEDADKFLFLDIACFFVEEDKDYVISILEGCDMFPADGINTLKKRCLLNIGSYDPMGSEKDNKILMHDLVRDMGRDIVRKESPDPGERSRIWLHKNAIEVLRSQTGTKKVQGLILNKTGPSEAFNTEAFRRMKNLRLLRLNHAHLSGNFEYISKNLRWLRWKEFSLESIPSDLDLSNLVVLDMQYSRLTMFSKDVKPLEKLKVLDLSHSKKLVEFPKFNHMRYLETLILTGCIGLVEVHESIGLLTQLVYLNLKGCKSLKNLPRSIVNLISLKKLNLAGCSKVRELPKQLGSLKSLVELVADGTAIGELPKSLENSLNLKCLSLMRCPRMFRPEKCALASRSLPAVLQELNLSYCKLTYNSFPHDLSALTILKVLKLVGNKFIDLPANIGNLSGLVNLSLNGCRSLQSVTLNRPGFLLLQAKGCPRLKAIDLTKSGRTALELQDCHQLREIKGYLTLEGSVANLHMFDILTRSRGSFTAALCQRGTYNLFQPENEVPSWFWQRRKGDTISFTVPSPEPSSKVVGFITCAIYMGHECAPPYPASVIKIINKTKKLDWFHDPNFFYFFDYKGKCTMWLSCWIFKNLTKTGSNSNSDLICRLWKEMEEGDQIEFSITFDGDGMLIVRNCGLHIIYEYHNNEPGLFRIEGSSWDSAATHAFQQLKATLTTTPVLRLPDITKPFVVETGTSNVGIDAVLMQEGQPIAYLTRKLSARHQHFTVYDKELLAIVMAVEKWHHYLMGRKFVVRMEYRIMQYLMEQELATPLQQKWLTILMWYDFEISYKEVQEHATAAALSRLARVKLRRLTFFGMEMKLMEQITASWRRDPHFRQLIDDFKKGRVSNSAYYWSHGLLRRKGKLVVGKDLPLRRKIIRLSHRSHVSGHSSIQATFKRVASFFFWKGRENDVRNFIKTCDICQRKKIENVAPADSLRMLSICEIPLSKIRMDFLEGLPNSGGCEVILLLVDQLSKYAYFFALSISYTASEVAQIFMDNIFKRHGVPSSILSDRDPIFVSEFLQECFRLQGLKLNHSQADGENHVINPCLEEYLRCMTSAEPSNWSTFLPLAEWWYNTAKHTSAHISPFEALSGYPPPTNLPKFPGATDLSDVDGSLQTQEEMIKLLKQLLNRAKNRMKQLADRKMADREFAVGDSVFVKLQPYKKGTMHQRPVQKLLPKYFGPFRIVDKIGKVAYKLALPPESRVHPNFHVSQLKNRVAERELTASIFPEPIQSFQGPRPHATLGRRMVKRGRIAAATQVLVQWANSSPDQANWEYLYDLQKRFPSFDFEDKAIEVEGGTDPGKIGSQLQLQEWHPHVLPFLLLFSFKIFLLWTSFS